jgi:uncharacterized protein YwgA
VLYRYLDQLDIPVTLYAPEETGAAELDRALLMSAGATSAASSDGPTRLEPAVVALAEIVARVHNQPYRSRIGRVMFQKIAYFATQAGLGTGLHYRRASYGPYSAELKPVLARLVNNGVLRELRRDKAFEVEPGPSYPIAARVWRSYLEKMEPIVDQVVDLVLRMRTTRQAEVAATVHFAALELEKESAQEPSEHDVLDAVRAWKQRRRPPLRDEEIAEAIRNLNMLGWLEALPSADLPLEDEEFLYA